MFWVATLVQALLHRALELVRNLRIAITMEDAPRLHRGLRKHLALDLAFEITRVRLDIDRNRSATRASTHLELARSVLKPVQRVWRLVDLEMPQLLLLDTLRVSLEVCHQVLDLLDLSVRVGVHDHGKILHQAEVCTHCIGQACKLAQLRDERNLVTSAMVFVDQQGLIHVANGFVVASTVVLLVASGSPLLVEGCCGTLRKVDSINLVGLLIIARNHRCTSECFLNRCLPVTTALLSLVPQIIDVVQAVVCPDYLEADVDV